MALTGIKDVDMKIIDNLNDIELGKVCRTNKYVKDLCDSEIFWINRILRIYPLTAFELKQVKEYLLFSNNKDLYIWLQKEYLSRPADIARAKVNFEKLKKNLSYNDFFEKILQKYSDEWKMPEWVKKEEFLIYLKRVLFKVFKKIGVNGGVHNDISDIVYEQVLNRNFNMPINEIINENPEVLNIFENLK